MSTNHVQFPDLFPCVKALPERSLSDAVSFDRRELRAILTTYGTGVARGIWRDYAIDHLRDAAIFSIFRRSSEVPVYRIEKRPKLTKRQGAYAVITATGLIMKRGPDLKRVLGVLDKKTLALIKG